MAQSLCRQRQGNQQGRDNFEMCASPLDEDAPVICAAEDEGLIFIGKTRRLSTYPAWARLLIRLVYWLTNYSADQESAGLARSWEEAASLCADRPDGYFGQRLPVGSLLPDEPCQLEPTVFFKTDAPDFYRTYRPKFRAVPTKEFDQLEKVIELHEAATRRSRTA